MTAISISPVIITIVLVLVRAVLAIAFFNEAFMKLKDVKKFSKNDSIPLPLAWFVALAELGAALSFVSGVLAQWAAIGVMLLMIPTTAMHLFKWKTKYWAQKAGWEYDVIMFVFAAVILAFGPGSLAINI